MHCQRLKPRRNSLGHKLATQINSSSDPLLFLNNSNIDETFYFVPTDGVEIEENILSIKNTNDNIKRALV